MHRLLFVCLFIGGPFLSAFNVWAESARTVAAATAVVRQWQADQRLYVKGDVGLTAEGMATLETWLDSHAPHWTVVLMRDASGETWQNKAGGPTWSGMDAVENALGSGLPAETAFGQLVHPRTRERDGAWLVIFLRERKFSYWAADAYDRRGLGEDHWEGNLDSPARQAMRGGGRIADAVQDTITSIDSELSHRMAREAEAKRQEEERSASLRVRTAAVIAEMRQAVQSIVSQAADLRRRSILATGTLTSPPTNGWLADLDGAARQSTVGSTPPATALLEKVQSEIKSWEEEFAANRNAPSALLSLQQEIDALGLHPWSASARTELLEARTLLRGAADAHAKADQGFSQALKEAGERLNAARTLDTIIRSQAAVHGQLLAEANTVSYPENNTATGLVMQARKMLADYAYQSEAGADGGNLLTQAGDILARAGRINAAEIRRAETLRQTGQVGGTAGAAALLLGGWAGNRRRRQVKALATLAFQQWEEALQKKTTDLFTLLDRAGRAIGTTALLERSGWTGTTRHLAQQTIQDVDQLFVMSSSLDQILERARGIIQPGNPLTKFRNLVSGGRYQATLDLLEKESIQFSPDSQIPAILRTAPEQEWKGLLGRREDCEPFSLTLSGLNEAFNERASRALSGLDRIDTAWTRIGSALTELDASIENAAALEKQVNAAGTADRRLGVNPVFTHLLPSAQEDASTAAKLGVSDPVQALDGPWADGSRKSGDAAAICQAVLDLRSTGLTVIEENEAALTAAHRQTRWIGAGLDELSGAADTLASTAVSSGIREALTAWEISSRSLRDRTSDAVTLMQRASSTSLPSISVLEARIQNERARLAAALGLKPERILTESGRNPSDLLTASRARLDASITELDRGDTTAALASLTEAASLVETANDLIDLAAKAYLEHGTRMKILTAESARLAALLPEHSSLLETLREGWAPAALRPAAADPTYPDPDETVADNLRRADDLLASAKNNTTAGATACREGALLASVDFHDRAGDDHAGAAQELEAIVRQRDAIQSIVQANTAQGERLFRHRAALHLLADEPVTMEPTRLAFPAVSLDLDTALSSAAATGPVADPFSAANALTAAGVALTHLEQRLQADRELFAEASRSLDYAGRQLAAALPLVDQAGNDNIPDSAATGDSREALSRLQDALTDITRALQQPHVNWPALDSAADQIAADAATWQAKLQGELARAAASVDALQRAAERVRAAGGWSGALGVRITGIPGHDRLEYARIALHQGNYDSATREAEAAFQEAQQAIDAAEAEQRRRRQEQEREEESRRRAAAQRRASAFSSNSGSSSGGSSSRSSSSRSSFSSGSGASRSGW